MNANNVVARPIWPTTLFFSHWSEHGQEAPGIISHVYKLREAEKENIASGVAKAAKPGEGLFESKFNIFDTDHPGMRKLTAFIGNTLCFAVSQLHQGRIAPNQLRACAVESWVHITNDGGFHDSHQHHQCSWCGIYYVQAGDVEPPTTNSPARNGINRFYSPIGVGGAYQDDGNVYLRNSNFDVTPEDGLLVLFPSYLLHSALPYRGRQDRIVIAFNAQLRRR
jgi:uncharacterized protein (TIGR02466 family)